MRLEAGDVDAAKAHMAVRRPELAGQHLEERALAGAVRSDEAAQLALGDREIDLTHGLDAAEMHRQAARLDERLGHAPLSRAA